MRLCLILLLALAFLFQPPLPPPIPPAPVPLHATFVTSSSAVVWWQQPAGVHTTCLRIYHVGAEWPAGICWDNLPEGLTQITLPGTLPPDEAFRPLEGDYLVLAEGMDDVGHATLGRTVISTTYLPLIGRQDSPRWRVRLAMVRA